MPRSQPYRIDWTEHPADPDRLNERLGSNFESIDQMLQMLFDDLAALSLSVTGAAASGASGVSMARVLTRVMVRN
jgi:hypothetical protein